MCKSDEIFVTSMRGCVIVWVCGEGERAREILGLEGGGRRIGAEHLICGDFGEELRRFGLI